MPSREDLVVTLGDYVDRGPDSKGVIDRLLELKETHNYVHLMGNHEIQMIRALGTKQDRDRFLSGLCGGQDTLDSYGGSFDDVLPEHWEFMKSAALYHELEDHILVHAGVVANRAVDDQDRETYYYQRFYSQDPHQSGKIVVCGHTRMLIVGVFGRRMSRGKAVSLRWIRYLASKGEGILSKVFLAGFCRSLISSQRVFLLLRS